MDDEEKKIVLFSILQNPEGIVNASSVLKDMDVPRATSNWIFSGFLYGSFAVVGLMPFIAGIGKQAKSKMDTLLGGIFGGVAFMLGAMILSTGLLANISDVYDKQIPSLVVTSKIFPLVGSIFAALFCKKELSVYRDQDNSFSKFGESTSKYLDCLISLRYLYKVACAICKNSQTIGIDPLTSKTPLSSKR